MALIVEDGTGKADAEAYCSVSDATSHHGKRGNADAWDAIEDKEAALRNATDYITAIYRSQWAGMRATADQALDWPRMDVPWDDSPIGVRPSNTIPTELKQACAELALRSASAPLLADLGRETLSERVDVISVTYAEGKTRQTHYALVNGLLRSMLVGGGGGFIPMERA